MKVCGQVYRCREDSFLILAFALAVELFPPFRYIMKAWLIICQDLYRLSFPEQNVADCRILHRVVFLKVRIQRPLSSCCRSGHQLVDIRTADRDRKKAYCCQYTETSTHVIRYHKGLISFLGRQIL